MTLGTGDVLISLAGFVCLLAAFTIAGAYLCRPKSTRRSIGLDGPDDIMKYSPTARDTVTMRGDEFKALVQRNRSDS